MEYSGANNQTTMEGNTKEKYSKKIVNAIPGNTRKKFKKITDLLKK